MDTVDEVMKRPYSRILIPSEVGGYDAKVLEFPGCFAQGDTADEAMEELDAAMRLWTEEVIKATQSVPEPMEAASYGGRVLFRLPKSWHRACSQLAQADGVSLNQWIMGAVGERLGAEGFSRQLVERTTRVRVTNITEWEITATEGPTTSSRLQRAVEQLPAPREIAEPFTNPIQERRVTK